MTASAELQRRQVKYESVLTGRLPDHDEGAEFCVAMRRLLIAFYILYVYIYTG
jgi:hypothetical protein